MIDDRGAISTPIKVCQPIFSGSDECGGLVGEKLATNVAQRDEIGGIGGRYRDKLTLALGQVNRKGVRGVGRSAVNAPCTADEFTFPASA